MQCLNKVVLPDSATLVLISQDPFDVRLEGGDRFFSLDQLIKLMPAKGQPGFFLVNKSGVMALMTSD